MHLIVRVVAMRLVATLEPKIYRCLYKGAKNI